MKQDIAFALPLPKVDMSRSGGLHSTVQCTYAYTPRSYWTACVVCLVVIVFAMLYAVAFSRYRSRARQDIVILQCDSAAFNSNMLSERSPIVCTNANSLGAITAFKRHSTRSQAQPTVYRTLYRQLRIGTDNPFLVGECPMWVSSNSRLARRAVQSRYDHTMLVMVSGQARVRIRPATTEYVPFRPDARHEENGMVSVVPDKLFMQSADRNKRRLGRSNIETADIILREGTAVILPIRWWMDITMDDRNARMLVFAWRFTWFTWLGWNRK